MTTTSARDDYDPPQAEVRQLAEILDPRAFQPAGAPHFQHLKVTQRNEVMDTARDMLRAGWVCIASGQLPQRVRDFFADELEAIGSPLCTCSQADSPPQRDGRPVTHHCDCHAVAASAVVRHGGSPTTHAKQCCTVTDDHVRAQLVTVTTADR